MEVDGVIWEHSLEVSDGRERGHDTGGDVCDDREDGRDRGNLFGGRVEQNVVSSAVAGEGRDRLVVDPTEQVQDERDKEEAEGREFPSRQRDEA